MDNREWICTISGERVGFIEHRANESIACARNGEYLARYDKKRNQTQTVGGAPICQGNILASFIFKKGN